MVINISPEQVEKITKFAYERVKGSMNLYKHRGETKHSKVIEDVIIGAMGEFAVHQTLSERNVNVSAPDLTIYETKLKSFDADLFNDDFKIHVKSQGTKSVKRYGQSWLFQRADAIVKNPEKNDWVAFTNVDLKTNQVTVVGFVKASSICKNDLWDECEIWRYRKTKVAVYLENFPKRIIKKCVK